MIEATPELLETVMSTDPEQRLPTEEQLSTWCDEIAEYAMRHDIDIAAADSLTAGNLAAMLGKTPASGEMAQGRSRRLPRRRQTFASERA